MTDQVAVTDRNDRRFTILSVLVAGLLVAVVVQSAVIFSMHKTLGQQERASQPAPSVAIREHSHTQPKALAPSKQSDQDRDPFAWGLDKWDPFAEMQSMQDRINQMFGSAFSRFQRSDDFGGLFREHPFAPDVNIEDKGDHYLLTVDLPGAEESKLDVKLDGQTLTISGSVQAESKETDKGKILSQERRTGQFHRIVTLPSPVKADKMTTTNKNGVLTVTIPKATQ